METIYENFISKNFGLVEHTQLKTDTKVDLPEGTKKILGIFSTPHLNPLAIAENDIAVSGRVSTRVVFLDELGKYDSVEQNTPFDTKIFVKNPDNYKGLQAIAEITDTKKNTDNAEVKNIIDINVLGVTEKNVRFVSGMVGDAETKTEKMQLGSFDTAITERFNVGDTVELDKNCEGVLGIDANATIRDISCGENKVSVKGIIAINILGIKSTENGTISFNTYDSIDFTKTFTVNGVRGNDIAIGNIAIVNKNIKIETGAILNIDLELAFNGATYTTREITNIVDAVSFTKELAFNFDDLEQTKPYPQINSYIDIENNINLSDGTPYISRVLSVDGAKIGALNILPLDNKISIEGVLSATVLWETENNEVNNYDMELPISFSVRCEGMDTTKYVNASVVPVILNVKARRGVELLIDARLAATVMVSGPTEMKIVTDIIMGADKVADDTAIHIHIVGDNETVWDIAKRTNIPSAELLSSNPNLANGCVAGDKVVVYHHKAINF